jgi:hypothetical protein
MNNFTNKFNAYLLALFLLGCFAYLLFIPTAIQNITDKYYYLLSKYDLNNTTILAMERNRHSWTDPNNPNNPRGYFKNKITRDLPYNGIPQHPFSYLRNGWNSVNMKYNVTLSSSIYQDTNGTIINFNSSEVKNLLFLTDDNTASNNGSSNTSNIRSNKIKRILNINKRVNTGSSSIINNTSISNNSVIATQNIRNNLSSANNTMITYVKYVGSPENKFKIQKGFWGYPNTLIIHPTLLDEAPLNIKKFKYLWFMSRNLTDIINNIDRFYYENLTFISPSTQINFNIIYHQVSKYVRFNSYPHSLLVNYEFNKFLIILENAISSYRVDFEKGIKFYHNDFNNSKETIRLGLAAAQFDVNNHNNYTIFNRYVLDYNDIYSLREIADIISLSDCSESILKTMINEKDLSNNKFLRNIYHGNANDSEDIDNLKLHIYNLMGIDHKKVLKIYDTYCLTEDVFRAHPNLSNNTSMTPEIVIDSYSEREESRTLKKKSSVLSFFNKESNLMNKLHLRKVKSMNFIDGNTQVYNSIDHFEEINNRSNLLQSTSQLNKSRTIIK